MKNKVLCIIETTWTDCDTDSQEVWMDLEPISRNSRKIEKVFPVYDHPHNDIENGQKETHYHLDTRYIHKREIPLYSTHLRINFPLQLKQKFEFRELIKWRQEEIIATGVNLISKSKLKRNCIHKGKCPHRGYDLSQIEPIDGVITCPLHSLKFNSITKQLINEKN